VCVFFLFFFFLFSLGVFFVARFPQTPAGSLLFVSTVFPFVFFFFFFLVFFFSFFVGLGFFFFVLWWVGES